MDKLTRTQKHALEAVLTAYMEEMTVSPEHTKVVVHRCVRMIQSAPDLMSLATADAQMSTVDAGKLIIGVFLKGKGLPMTALDSPSSSEVREAIYALYDDECRTKG